MEIRFEAKLWQWQAKDSWYFVTVPVEFSEEIGLIGSSHKKGFGSVRVKATIGKSTWDTSVFPDTKSKSYLLPIKKEIRTAESLKGGTIAVVSIRLLEV